MKFSWKWLNTIIDLKAIPLDEIINKLTLAGFEIEYIDNKLDLNDKTLNINITANRGDASSIIGLARELSTIFNLKISYELSKIENTINKDYIINKSIKYETNKLLYNSLLDIQFSIINEIAIRESPEWLKNYLKGSDINPTNTFSDIAEYIKIKWGQDIEIFDLQKIDNNIPNINFIKVEKTLHENKYLETLTYNNKIISILGIESNPKIQCGINTSSIIILGHICKPKYIEQIINILNKKTEKSQKHLKNISRNDFIYAYIETIEIIQNLAKNTNIDIQHSYRWHAFQSNINSIKLNKTTINNILGPSKINNKYLTETQIIKILEQLKFQPKYQDNIFSIIVPEYRSSDIQRPIDVIEEIGKIYGFENFLDTLPNYSIIGKTSSENIFIKKIRFILRNLGLHEVMHYSMENIPNKTSNIKLYNHLLEDQKELRSNLINHLLNTIEYNKKKKNIPIECFEIGRVFQNQNNLSLLNKTKYIENIHIAGIMGNNEFSKIVWSEKSRELSWFQAKGLLENLFENLHANIKWKQADNNQLFKINNNWNKICHPYRCAIIQNQKTEEKLGIFSELNIKYAKELNKNYHIYIFEINLEKLIQTITPKNHLSYRWKPYSHYPSVIRDISLILYQDEQATLIQKLIFSQSNSLAKSVEIFQEYNISDNLNKYRSVSFRITYRSSTRTLNDNDIKKIDHDIHNLLDKLDQNKRKIIVE